MLNEILKKFDISVPKEQYILEYFLENTETVYHIDFLPRAVDNEKYDEINVIYCDAIDDSNLMDRYMCVENRYVNAMIKLWAYSRTFINIDTVYTPIQKTKKYIGKKFKKYFPLIVERNTYAEMIPVRNLEEMNFYTCISLRDIANVIYYLKDLDLLIFTNWSCLTLVFLNNNHFDFVKEVINSEGLFLRKAK